VRPADVCAGCGSVLVHLGNNVKDGEITVNWTAEWCGEGALSEQGGMGKLGRSGGWNLGLSDSTVEWIRFCSVMDPGR
jgi:hypothetical protein